MRSVLNKNLLEQLYLSSCSWNAWSVQSTMCTAACRQPTAHSFFYSLWWLKHLLQSEQQIGKTTIIRSGKYIALFLPTRHDKEPFWLSFCCNFHSRGAAINWQDPTLKEKTIFFSTAGLTREKVRTAAARKIINEIHLWSRWCPTERSWLKTS